MSRELTMLLGSLAAMFGAEAAQARVIACPSKVETVLVAPGTATRVTFDKTVKTVTNAARFEIRPENETNPDYKAFLVDARSPKAVSFVTFVMADGETVRTKFMASVAAQMDMGDSTYDFKTDGCDTPADSAVKLPEVKAIDLMKAMIRGDRVMGYEVRDAVRVLLPGDKGVRAELVKLYTGGDFNGYVIHLKNQASKPYLIDIRGLRVGEPDLAVLSQIGHKVLEPAGTAGSDTDLRVVARPGLVYRDMVLPVAPVTKKEKGGVP